MRRAVWLLILVVVLGAGAASLHRPTRTAIAARFGAAPPSAAIPIAEPPPPAVTVAVATARVFRDQLFVSGTVTAREEALVGVQIDGLRIAEVKAEDGDRVAAGQVLARLDRSQLDAQTAQSEAALARADSAILQARAQISQFEATLAQAQADFERGRQLGAGVLTQSSLDNRVAAAKGAAAQLEGARSTLGVAQAERKNQEALRRELDVRIARTEVRAPVAGIVSRRSARVGALAMGSSEPLFRLIENGAFDLDAEAADDVLVRVRPGMPVAVRLGADESTIAGTVRLVASEVDRATRLGRVRIALPTDAASRIGAFASAVIEIAARDGVAVPASAVTRGECGRVVQVVANGHVEQRPVETGLAFRDLVEIREGLKAGEYVVARAAAFLRPGDAVRPIEPDMKAASR